MPQLVSGGVGVNTAMRAGYKPAFGRAVERVSGKNARASRGTGWHVLRTNSSPLLQITHSYAGVLDMRSAGQTGYFNRRAGRSVAEFKTLRIALVHRSRGNV